MSSPNTDPGCEQCLNHGCGRNLLLGWIVVTGVGECAESVHKVCSRVPSVSFGSWLVRTIESSRLCLPIQEPKTFNAKPQKADIWRECLHSEMEALSIYLKCKAKHVVQIEGFFS